MGSGLGEVGREEGFSGSAACFGSLLLERAVPAVFPLPLFGLHSVCRATRGAVRRCPCPRRLRARAER